MPRKNVLKTETSSHDNTGGLAAIHCVSAFAATNQLILGQLVTDAKSNEITTIPKRLDTLAISGCLVTIAAMGCQKAIAAKIIDCKADYLLALKGNQKMLADEVDNFLSKQKLLVLRVLITFITSSRRQTEDGKKLERYG